MRNSKFEFEGELQFPPLHAERRKRQFNFTFSSNTEFRILPAAPVCLDKISGRTHPRQPDSLEATRADLKIALQLLAHGVRVRQRGARGWSIDPPLLAGDDDPALDEQVDGIERTLLGLDAEAARHGDAVLGVRDADSELVSERLPPEPPALHHDELRRVLLVLYLEAVQCEYAAGPLERIGRARVPERAANFGAAASARAAGDDEQQEQSQELAHGTSSGLVRKRRARRSDRSAGIPTGAVRIRLPFLRSCRYWAAP